MSSPMITTAGRALTPFVFLYGAYVTLFGVLTPGGGFPGGMILASGVILVIVTHSTEDIKALASRIEWFDILGAFAFLCVGLMGMLIGGAYLTNLYVDPPIMLVLLDIIVALKVFAGTTALFIFFFKLEDGSCSTD